MILFRNVLNKVNVKTQCIYKTKWGSRFETISLEWNFIFKICFDTILDNNIIWFQYRIIYRILGTQSLRKKMGTSDTSLCRICNNQEETLEHLFLTCPYVENLWAKIKTSFACSGTELGTTNPVDILLGTWQRNKNCKALNTLCLITKYYIFQCAKKCQKPSFKALQHYIQIFYEEQQYLAKIKNQENNFDRQWTLASQIIILE